MSEALLFDLPETRAPVPGDIRREATFSDSHDCRYTLTRTWRSGPYVCFIGINPSTADARREDPTSRRWTHFAHAWGYGGFVAVNLYPFITPDPRECKRWSEWHKNGPDYYARDRIHQNIRIVGETAKAAALVVACWGAGAWDDAVVEIVVEEIIAGSEPWPDIYCLDVTADGSPKHPMARGAHRVPDEAKPVLWRKA